MLKVRSSGGHLFGAQEYYVSTVGLYEHQQLRYDQKLEKQKKNQEQKRLILTNGPS